MYLYKKEMYDKLRFHFQGDDRIEENNSQCLQDMFVLAVLNGKREGTFLEIGGFHASYLSNTYLLEKMFDWGGWSFDIDIQASFSFNVHRMNTEFILADAVIYDYKTFLENIKRVDYLSLDIEPSYQTLACLKNLPLKDVRFTVITYETDFYDPLTPKEESEAIRKESRKILEDNDYILVAGNISNLTDDAPFEDWYIDSTYIPKNIVNFFKRDNDTPLASHKYMLKDSE